MFWIWFSSVAIGIISWAYWYSTRHFGIWEAKGLTCIEKPLPLLGNLWKLLSGKHTLRTHAQYHYEKSRGKKVAIIYMGTEPQLYIRDPELIKALSIKDFDHFVNSGFLMKIPEDMEINKMGLITDKDELWRKGRSIMALGMTKKNLNVIMSYTPTVIERMLEVAHDKSKGDNVVDIEQLIHGFTIECIMKMCFGVKIDALTKPENPICKHLKSMLVDWRIVLSLLTPEWFIKAFDISIFNPSSVAFLRELIKGYLDKKKAEGFGTNDNWLSMALQARGDNEESFPDDVLTMALAQFMFDSVETLGESLIHTIYRIAIDEDIQDRLHWHDQEANSSN